LDRLVTVRNCQMAVDVPTNKALEAIWEEPSGESSFAQQEEDPTGTWKKFPGFAIAHYKREVMKALGKRVKDTEFKCSGGIEDFIIVHCGAPAESAAKATSFWYLVKEPETENGRVQEQWAWLSGKDNTLRKMQPATRDKKFDGLLQRPDACKDIVQAKNERVLYYKVISPKGKLFVFTVRTKFVPSAFFSKIKKVAKEGKGEGKEGAKKGRKRGEEEGQPKISQQMLESVGMFKSSGPEGDDELEGAVAGKRKQKGNADAGKGKKKKLSEKTAGVDVWQAAYAMAAGAGNRCPVGKTSPVTPVNLLAYMEWQRMRGEPLAGTMRFGHLQNMGEIMGKEEGNRVAQWMYNALRLAHDEWRADFFVPPPAQEPQKNGNKMTFEEEAAALFE